MYIHFLDHLHKSEVSTETVKVHVWLVLILITVVP